jgi:dipeptidyl-peptidase-4
VEVGDDLTYLKDGKSFVWSSERDGYKRLYLYSFDGKKSQQITWGAWDVTTFYGVDEARGLLYYASAETHPRERQLYLINLKTKNKVQISHGAGTHEGAFSPTFSYYFDTYSAFGTPPVTTLFDAAGKVPRLVKVVEDNAALKTRLGQFALSAVEFIEVPLPGDEKIKLNGWMLKPANFDATKKYPAILYVYGGPGSQTGQDDWSGPNYFWFQYLAQQGYVIISMDNRGTGARGAAFKKCTYANLGKLEIQDQMDVARWAGAQPYIDKGRIGMWGWSFGGYMTSLAMTKGADLFKTGVAVAPVTNWRFYDTVYTERFLKTPQENPAGYDENSPVSHAAKLKGNFLMIHGTGDDNVHFQNAVALEDALIKANKQFSSFYYPNRNHGIYGGVTRLHLYRMMTDYFVKNL